MFSIELQNYMYIEYNNSHFVYLYLHTVFAGKYQAIKLC